VYSSLFNRNKYETFYDIVHMKEGFKTLGYNRGMWSKIKQNWRELAGWVAIAGFAGLTIYEISEVGSYSNRGEDASFDLFIKLIALVLVWLWLNRKSV